MIYKHFRRLFSNKKIEIEIKENSYLSKYSRPTNTHNNIKWQHKVKKEWWYILFWVCFSFHFVYYVYPDCWIAQNLFQDFHFGMIRKAGVEAE